MIKYFEIDNSNDMVIATSGRYYVNYNRIISSTTFPYTVIDSKTYRDPEYSSTRKLYAIYIIDLNNLVSLIYDSDPSSLTTDLAKINFLTQSISY